MRRLVILLFFVFISGLLLAQNGSGAFNGRISKGDVYYKEALDLQKKADALKSSGKNKEAKAKYNEALKKFEGANDYYNGALEVVGVTESEIAKAKKKLADVKKQKNNINKSISALSQKQYTKLEVSETNLNFASASSGESVVIINGDNWKYNSEDLPWWIECRKTDTGLYISCSNNTSIESRSFPIVVTADGNQSVEIHIEQNAAQVYVSIDKTNLTFDMDGGSKDVMVNTNAPSFEVQCASNWLEITKKSDSFNVVCVSNPYHRPRTAQVIISTSVDKDKKSYLLVSQAKKSFWEKIKNFFRSLKEKKKNKNK